MNDDWKKDLPVLEVRKHYKLPNGATIFVTSWNWTDKEGKDLVEDGIIYQPGDGNSIHVNSGDTESGANVQVCFYDNLNVEVWGQRKANPKYIIKGDEWPCEVALPLGSNITVVTRQRIASDIEEG